MSDAVRRLLAGQPDELELLQMLGLEPGGYRPGGRGGAHGTYRSYAVRGCRCDLCLAAHRRDVATKRARSRAGLVHVTSHGRWGYLRGCRCDTCRVDNSARARENRYKRKRRLEGAE